MVSNNRALAMQTTGRPMAVTGRPSCCRARPCVGRRQAGPGVCHRLCWPKSQADSWPARQKPGPVARSGTGCGSIRPPDRGGRGGWSGRRGTTGENPFPKHVFFSLRDKGQNRLGALCRTRSLGLSVSIRASITNRMFPEWSRQPQQ